MKAQPFTLRPFPRTPRYCPHPHIATETTPLRVGLAQCVADFEMPRGSEAFHKIARSAPAAAVAVALLCVLLLNLARDRDDQSEIELVMLQTPPEVELIPEPEPEVIPEPEPIPEAVVVTPVEPVPVVQIAKVEPLPAPLVRAPTPKPPPAVAKPAPKPLPRPQIVVEAMPKPQAPPPVPVVREPLRRVAPPTEHRLRPPVAIAAVPEALESPEALPTRVANSRPFRGVPAPAKVAPRLDPLRSAEPSVVAQAPTPRRARESRDLPISASRQRGVAPLPVAMPTEETLTAKTEISREPRRTSVRPAPTRKQNTLPNVQVAALSAPAKLAPAPPEPKTRRSAARIAPAKAASRAPQRVVAPTAARSPAPEPPRENKTPTRLARAVVPVAAGATDRSSDGEDKPNGVPLGSLASCLRDQEETALKQAILSSVKTQKECKSDAGHYRFLQTRNLNAFLMWVEPAPDRVLSDRCIELAHALDCLKKPTTESPKR